MLPRHQDKGETAARGVNMAVAMREAAGKLIAAWRRHGCDLGFGASIAQGYATLGQIGFSERFGDTALGTVCNLADQDLPVLGLSTASTMRRSKRSESRPIGTWNASPPSTAASTRSASPTRTTGCRPTES